MVTFTNDHGQEPSPSAHPDFGKPSAAQIKFRDQLRARGRLVPVWSPLSVARVGREGIDTKQCQAPCKPAKYGNNRLRCDRPATCVIVENKPRPDGAIGGMALCDLCYQAVLSGQGPNYAKMTPLVKP